jgi:predicted O-methyltransferase YrrM
MSQILQGAIEAYLAGLNGPVHPVASEVAREGRAEGIAVVDDQAACLLHLLARAVGARRVLEIGTAIGYSTIALATALPEDGLLVGIERNPERAARARANLARAGVGDRANIMIGEASRLVAKVSGPFDLILQDGDKAEYDPLLDRLVALLRPGGLLVTDNALWNGEVIPGYVAEPIKNADDTAAIAAYNKRITSDERLLTMILPIGDGVAVSVKRQVGYRMSNVGPV